MDVYDNCSLSAAHTPYKNILETLDAVMLIGDEEEVYEKGEVVIAAANPDVMEDYIHEGDMVILGNRYESQLCAIEMNAACIVVCMDAKVSRTIRKLAQEHNCNIIVTPHDTFTVARMINQSMPISHFMKEENEDEKISCAAAGSGHDDGPGGLRRRQQPERQRSPR